MAASGDPWLFQFGCLSDLTPQQCERCDISSSVNNPSTTVSFPFPPALGAVVLLWGFTASEAASYWAKEAGPFITGRCPQNDALAAGRCGSVLSAKMIIIMCSGASLQSGRSSGAAQGRASFWVRSQIVSDFSPYFTSSISKKEHQGRLLKQFFKQMRVASFILNKQRKFSPCKESNPFLSI